MVLSSDRKIMLRRLGYYDEKSVTTLYDAKTHLKKNLENSLIIEICQNV